MEMNIWISFWAFLILANIHLAVWMSNEKKNWSNLAGFIIYLAIAVLMLIIFEGG